MPSYRVLGLAAGASKAEIKVAYLGLAKKWHPDLHKNDVKAEEKFKMIQQAYEVLTGRGNHQPQQQRPHQSHYDGVGARRRRAGAAGAGGHNWGTGARYGPAGEAGYNPHQSYMGFGKDGKHWYEDTEAASKTVDTQNHWKMFASTGVFLFGLWLVQSSGARDQRAKEKGELVDAWWNHTTRRWETPKPQMYKDPLLSSLIDLKPPSMVYGGKSQLIQQANRASSTRTLDGLTPEQAYRLRQTGTRS